MEMTPTSERTVQSLTCAELEALAVFLGHFPSEQALRERFASEKEARVRSDLRQMLRKDLFSLQWRGQFAFGTVLWTCPEPKPMVVDPDMLAWASGR